MWEDCPSSRVRQGLLPRGESPHSADHRARYPGLINTKATRDALNGDGWGGELREDMACECDAWLGWREVRFKCSIRGENNQKIITPDCESTFSLRLMCNFCVFCRATSPLCLRTTRPVLRLTLRGLSSVCGTPQVNCGLHRLFFMLTFGWMSP